MSLQLILGNSGAGKTHYLYEEIIQQSIQHPEVNYLVIVPEQYTMQTQKELVMRHPKGGILNIDVLSFGRLAHRIFGELGTSHGMVLDDEGKNLILRKIAGDLGKDLKVIGKNLNKFGYISEVKSVISEFTQYDIDLDTLESMKDSVGKDTMLSFKLEDIYKIYKAFRCDIEGTYITGEELLDYLTQAIYASDIVKNSVVTLDGFTGFTPVQNRLITELMKLCDKVYMTVTIDEKTNPYSYHTPYELFALSKETVSSAIKLAKDNHIEVEEPITLFQKPVYRFRDNPELAFVESHIFRYGLEKYEEQPERISLSALMTPEDESMWVARQIRNLVRTQGYRYRDIAVITSNMDAYGGYLKKACELYQIPMFADQTRSILLNSFVEFIRSLLAMVEENYSYQATFRFLKAGSGNYKYFGGKLGVLEDAAIDSMENYVLECGIQGYKAWSEGWTIKPRSVSDIQLAKLEANRSKFMAYHEGVRSVLKNPDKNIKDICKVLYEFFDKYHMQSMIENRAEDFKAKGLFALEKEENQIYGVVLELFDKMVGILGDEKVSLKEFMELFDAGLQEARVGVIPPTTDQVLVGDLQRTRMNHVKALFFVGMSDAYLPGKMSSGGILSEQDRESMMEQKVKLKPNSKEQMYLQKFYLYMNLTKPTEALYLSYAKAGADGKVARASYLVGEFRKLFPKLECQEVEFAFDTSEITPQVGLYFVIDGLRDKKLQESKRWQELYAWYQVHPEWSKELEKIQDAYYYKRIQEQLTEEVATALYGTILENSVSRLEKFASCPYAHFLNYGIGLREREVYEFEVADIGTVLHAAMERFSNHVKEAQKEWTGVTKEEQIAWADQAVEESVRDYNNNLFNQSNRDAYMVERFKRLMHKTVWAVIEQLKAGEFTPKGFEVRFGFDDNVGEQVELSDTHKMKLRGVIDRVDLYEDDDKIMVKIVDYKSGKKDIELSDLYHGLQLQLFVYLDKAMKAQEGLYPDKEIIPAAGFYYQIDDPIVERKSKKTIEELILNKLKVTGIVNEEAVKQLDKAFEFTSDVIPVNILKSTGSWGMASKNISQEGLDVLLKFTDNKVKEIGRKIAEGNIEIHPYKYKNDASSMNGCAYCDYKRICEFDAHKEEKQYNELEKLHKIEALNRMASALEGQKGGQ